MKECIKCNVKKDEIYFHFKNKNLNIRNGTCKVCSSEYKKNHYNKNRKKYIKKAKTRNTLIRKENMQKLLTYLSDKSCVDCNNTNILVLEFDHKELSKKKFNVTNSLDSSWKTILNEINKCEIRCSNCHKIKTHKQFNTRRFIYSQII